MSQIAKAVMRKFYREATDDPSQLPWHREEPSIVLRSAVNATQRPGRALDLGCGAGALSVWLARRGLEVTGIDLLPEATAMARSVVDGAGVRVDLVTADLFEYTPSRPFDLVYDSGCLHSLVGGSVQAYKRQMISWLAPGGHLVIEHWGKRHALDWRPIGPRRRSRAKVESIFAPELELEEVEESDLSVPLPFGPRVRGAGYWFRRRQT